MGIDPRHARRISLMQALFALSFPHHLEPTQPESAGASIDLQSESSSTKPGTSSPDLQSQDLAESPLDVTVDETQIAPSSELDAEIIKIKSELPQIDSLLQLHAPQRPLKDINKVDLAILRLTMFEWNSSQTPKKVLIDEAVELAKEFGSDTSSSFVNGVLAKIYTEKGST